MLNTACLPPALAPLGAYKQFIVYRKVQSAKPGKLDKLPFNPYTTEYANAHDPAGWFDAVTARALADAYGAEYDVGFVLTRNDPFFFIDIDGCLLTDGWSPLAREMLQRFAGAAVEVSVSGRGLHIIGTGAAPPHKTRRAGVSLELYTENRFVALTGTHASGNAASDHAPALAALVRDYGLTPDADAATPDWTTAPVPEWRGPEDDTQLIKRALRSHSVGSIFGTKASFADLWTANNGALCRAYPAPDRGYDASIADSALAQHLAFWTGKNCERIRSLMMQSALRRAKWDREDYLRITILKVVARQKNVLQRNDATDTRTEADASVTVDLFWAHMPSHQYLFMPTGELWPASSVNARLAKMEGPDGKLINANVWLDQNRHIEQMTWAPAEPQFIHDRVVSQGGWAESRGCTCFNLYQPPTIVPGDATKADPWRDHVRRIYPEDAEHIEKWLAHRVQRPGEKLNHALVLGGNQGIGKDTVLEPVKHAVGHANFHEASPTTLLGRFTPFAKSVILRISEARDLGDTDRFAFYDHLKVYTAAPPDVLRVDEKNLRDYYVPNVCGVIITTNHKLDGIYLPPDDRRHYIAWSEAEKEHFGPSYFPDLYRWFNDCGIRHVAAFLRDYDLSGFDAKAPPPKTPAFWDIVRANSAPEDAEMADALDAIGNPKAVTIADLAGTSPTAEFRGYLCDRRNARAVPHRLERAGYVRVHNSTKDGLWIVNGKRQAIYARSELPFRDRISAAQHLCSRCNTVAGK